jgi:hypothetical protein
MKLKLLLAAVLLAASVGASGCVSKAEFEAFKADQESKHEQIKIDGDSVDLWIAQVDPFLRWVFNRASVLDPGSNPPPLPPPPPPDGAWE